ncbi:MAG: 2-amino-4-hydroxy-6-hydroxymethyldihydropteridine diphosphokinase [candidate division WOR-3 bacterium]
MSQVFLGLGANVGNRLRNFELAVAHISHLGPVRRSFWYETEPVGMPDAASFLNGVLRLDTTTPPTVLLDQLLAVEQELGRKQAERSGPRTIDIDILLYGTQIVDKPGLCVPHPRMHERAFVLVPLCDLAPDAVHPRLGRTMRELLDGLDTSGVRKQEY